MASPPRRWFRSIQGAAFAGLAYAVLSFASLVLLTRQPEPGASDAEIAAWYADSTNGASVILGLNLAVFAGIAFLWFVAVIRRRIGDREDRFFATVFFGSGILYVALLLVGSTALSVLSVVTSGFDAPVPDRHDQMLAAGFGGALMLTVVPRIQAVFIITTSTLILRTGAFKRGIALFGYAIAVALLFIPILLEPIGLAFPIWVAVVSASLLIRASERT
jgi:hypothetical protein